MVGDAPVPVLEGMDGRLLLTAHGVTIERSRFRGADVHG
jgi:hypothetical protein